MVYDLDGNMGKKVKILMKRVEEIWGGTSAEETKKDDKKQNVVTTSQPISEGMDHALVSSSSCPHIK